MDYSKHVERAELFVLVQSPISECAPTLHKPDRVMLSAFICKVYYFKLVSEGFFR